MNRRGQLWRLLDAARNLDGRLQRARRPDIRSVVFDARTSMEYGVMAPVHRRLLGDSRVRTWLMARARPDGVRDVFRDAPAGSPMLSPRQAMLKRFDAYVSADSIIWAKLPRGTCRVQMFHGVAGKWSDVYDRPSMSMRHWDRLFFINRRRLQNYVLSGAIDRDSPAIRLVGMPKTDCLVDGTLSRNAVLEANGMDPSRKTVMYAPTWTRFSSLNAMGEDVVAGLIAANYRVLVKLHDNSLDPGFNNSGGVNWVARLEPILARGHGHLLASGDASPWLVAADVLITDHSSIGFEYLLLDRPLIRIAMPQLISGAKISNEYVDLMTQASTTVRDAAEVLAAVETALADPGRLSKVRRVVAAELFHDPGNATNRAVQELYALMELDMPADARPLAPARTDGVRAEGAFAR